LKGARSVACIGGGDATAMVAGCGLAECVATRWGVSGFLCGVCAAGIWHEWFDADNAVRAARHSW